MKKLDSAKTSAQIEVFIKKTMRESGFETVIVAVSGGVDSATSVSLAVRALESRSVHALLLPYKEWQSQAVVDTQELLRQLDLPEKNIHVVDIAPFVDTFANMVKLKGSTQEPDQLRLGNVMARSRMIVLFDLAKKLSALVVGTENKSEHYLGYFTRFGDEASDLEPLRQLYKTHVYELATYLNVPKSILTKAPTAGLWQGQTDEAEFGFTYKEADEVFLGLFDEHISKDLLVKNGLKSEIIEKVTNWVKKVDFKHDLPIIGPLPVFKSP